MHWYNPKTRTPENRPAPVTDADAAALLDGHMNSDAFLAEYDRLRASGMGIGQALIFTGHEFQLKHLEFRAAR